MATLAQSVSATPANLESDLWTISADLSDAVDYLQVESEIVRVVGNFPAQYQRATATTSVPKIRVERAAGGTTAASHADGTTLTPLIPPSASGGGAAEAGTVVVTPPSEVDIGAALEAAGEPSAENPYLTVDHIEVKDEFGIVRASVLLGVDPEVRIQTFDAAGDPTGAAIGITLGGVISVGAGGSEISFDPDGSLFIAGGNSNIQIEADGTIKLFGNVGSGVTISPDGSIDLNGIVAVNADFTAVINGLFTVDGDGNLRFGSSGTLVPTWDPGTGGVWSNPANAGALTIGDGS